MKTAWTPFPLSCVRVTDAYAKNAFEKEIAYLLSLEPGRLLAGFYENAGLGTRYVRYGGWESMLMGGHTLGHFLSALAHAYASADGEMKEVLLGRLRTVIYGLDECQRALGTGLIWGAVTADGGVEAQFDHVERGETDIQREAWVPWYTLHKLLAGIIDAAVELGEGEGVQEVGSAAMAVAKKLGDWVADRALSWDKRTAKRVLSVEYGGMNDCLYSLYSLTHDPRHAAAAHVFDEERLFDGILEERPDFLDGKHANTTIPKILGAFNRYAVLHGERLGGKTVDASRYLAIAETFFRTVVEKHTYVTGGSSEWEHFGRDGVLDAERTNCNCETCIVYNMLKLARGLFCATGKREYLDYYDNAFTNAILSSQNPETGMTTYFQPMASGFFKVFSRPYDKFWCCTGSGMENFSKLGDGIYYEDGETVVVARYLSSQLKTEKCELALRAAFPFEETGTLTISRAAGPIKILLRIPDWCKEAEFRKNGVPVMEREGDFCIVTASAGDVIGMRFFAETTLCGLPDSGDVFAFRYGGVVLSADFGTEDMEETTTGVEVTIPKKQMGSETVWFQDVHDVLAHPSAYLIRDGEQFRLHGADRPLLFGPHYRRFRERYAIYLRFREFAWENGKPVKRETVSAREQTDSVQPGYGQYETDELHAMREKKTASSTSDGTYRYAKAGGYFEYDFAVDPKKRNILAVTLSRADNGKPLKIEAGGQVLFAERLLYTMGEEWYVREISIPPEALKTAKKKRANGREFDVLTVRFMGFGGRNSAKLCEEIRMFAEDMAN